MVVTVRNKFSFRNDLPAAVIYEFINNVLYRGGKIIAFFCPTEFALAERQLSVTRDIINLIVYNGMKRIKAVFNFRLPSDGIFVRRYVFYRGGVFFGSGKIITGTVLNIVIKFYRRNTPLAGGNVVIKIVIITVDCRKQFAVSVLFPYRLRGR